MDKNNVEDIIKDLRSDIEKANEYLELIDLNYILNKYKSIEFIQYFDGNKRTFPICEQYIELKDRQKCLIFYITKKKDAISINLYKEYEYDPGIDITFYIKSEYGFDTFMKLIKYETL